MTTPNDINLKELKPTNFTGMNNLKFYSENIIKQFLADKLNEFDTTICDLEFLSYLSDKHGKKDTFVSKKAVKQLIKQIFT